MCARFNLTQSATSLSEYFGLLAFPAIKPRFNIAPTQPVLCLKHDRKSIKPVFFRWGLIPSWAKDISFGTRAINARSETIAEKPTFRQAWKSRRCVVLADGFYEWKSVGGRKMPFQITTSTDAARSPMLMAGLWESWRDPDLPEATPVETCTVITTEANDRMRELHDRMPVLLEKSDLDVWLSDDRATPKQRLELLKPCNSSLLTITPANPWLNRVTNEGPRCLEPPEDGEVQGALF